MARTKIVLNQQSDLILNNAQIVQPTGIEKTDLPGLVDDLASLDSAIEAEETRALAAESGLQSAIDVEKGRIDAILDGSTVDLDQFKEVVDFVEAIDLANDNSLLAAVTSINSDIDAEEAARIAGDAQLTSDLAAEVAARIADVNDEETRATAAEAALSSDLADEVTAREVAVSAEETRAMAAEAALSSDLADLQSYVDTTVDSAIATLTSDLADEEAARIADVDAEEARAMAVEASLRSDLDAEIARAIEAEESLDARIVDIISNTDLTAIDSFTEIVNNVGVENKSGISDYQWSRYMDLLNGVQIYTNPYNGLEMTTEDFNNSFGPANLINFESWFTTEVKSLSMITSENLSSEISNREAGDAQLTSDLAAEVASRELAISTEEAARIAGDTQLQSNLDAAIAQEVLDRTAAIEAANTDLTNESSERIAGDAQLQSQLDALALADGETLDIDYSDNSIRLKEVVAAPDSGVRSFEGDIKVSQQPDTQPSYNELSLITKGIMDTRLSEEVSTLNTSISNEQARAEGIETGLQSQIDTERGRIDAILDASEADKDNFAEIVQLINSVDTTNDEAFASYVLSNNQALADEIAERLRLTNLLGDGIVVEQQAREDADAALQSDIDALPMTDGKTLEVNYSDNTIQLKEFIDAPDSGIRVFEGDVKASEQPVNLPTFGDLSYITKLYVDEKVGTDLTEAIQAEEDARTAADAALQSALDTEVADRIADVDAEEARAIAAEEALDAAKLDLAGGTMSGNINMDGSSITNVDVITTNELFSPNGLVQFTGTLGMNDGIIAELGAPTNDGDATNKLYVDTEISTEEAARIAGDEALSTSIDNLQTYVNETVDSAIATLTSDLADETAAREAAIAEEHAHHVAAEAALQSAIDVEKGRIDAILAGSDVDLDQFAEIVSFVEGIDLANDNSLLAAVTQINSDIDAEETRAMAAEATLTSDLADEVAARELAISTEEAARIAGDAQLSSDLADLQSYVDTTVDSAIATLTSDLAAETAARIADVDAEEARAMAAEAALSSDLADLQSYVDTTVDSAISTLTSDLADETAARIADVDAEETRAMAAEALLQSNLTLESNERMAEDITLQGNIDTEATRAQAAEVAIATDLATEVAARIADVNEEETRAMAAEAALTADLTAEETRAMAAETLLQSNIDVEKGRIDAILSASTADADTFAEIVALINSIDTTNDTAFASYVLSNDAALASEISRAQAAELELTTDLAAEETRAMAAEAVLTADLDAEETRAMAAEAALTSALSAEEASRIAGDATLQSSLSNEILDRAAADTQLTSDLAAEVAARIADVDAEETRAMAAEAVLTSDLADEVARAEAAEAALAADIANIYSKKVAVSGTPNGTLTTFSLASPVRLGSEMIYVNGLLMEEGEDYTTVLTSGKVSSVEFIVAPTSAMKVRAYGVYGI